jgi:BRCT domain type II-containing protein
MQQLLVIMSANEKRLKPKKSKIADRPKSQKQQKENKLRFESSKSKASTKATAFTRIIGSKLRNFSLYPVISLESNTPNLNHKNDTVTKNPIQNFIKENKICTLSISPE